MFELIEKQDWIAATKLANFVGCIYVLSYSRYHPAVGVHALLAASCAWNAMDNAFAELWANLASIVLNVSHGTQSQLVSEALQILQNVEIES